MPSRRPSLAEAQHAALAARIRNLTAGQQSAVWSGYPSVAQVERRVEAFEAENRASRPVPSYAPAPEWNAGMRIADASWQASQLRPQLVERFGDEERARRYYERQLAAVFGAPSPTTINLARGAEDPKTMDEPKREEQDPRRRVLSALASGGDVDELLEDEECAGEYAALARRAQQSKRSVSELARQELEDERLARAEARVQQAGTARRAAERFGGDPSRYGRGGEDDPAVRARAADYGVSPAEMAQFAALPEDEQREALAEVAARPRKSQRLREKRRQEIEDLQAELASPSQVGGSPAEQEQLRKDLKRRLAQLLADEAADEAADTES